MLTCHAHRNAQSYCVLSDPLERYFSQQRHRGGSNDNPTVQHFRQNSQFLMHPHSSTARCELKSMNIEPAHAECSHVSTISVVRVLLNWYTEQRATVLWNKGLSQQSSVSNGVRQGGVLLPHTFYNLHCRC